MMQSKTYTDKYLLDGIDSNATMWTAFAFLVGLKPSKNNKSEIKNSRVHDDLVTRNTEGNRSKYE